MKTIMAAKSPHDSSFSFSRRYLNFHWKKKGVDEDDEEEILNISSSTHFSEEDEKEEDNNNLHQLMIQMPKELASSMPWEEVKKMKKKKHYSKSKFKSALHVFTKSHHNLGTRVMVGTLFGYRRGHVHFALQEDPKAGPIFMIQLATPTCVLVREMASGMVRIALECEKKGGKNYKGVKLLEEPLWRTYCNGKKCGYANRHECGAEEWKILKAVEPISMGAGVLPMSRGNDGVGSEGELMYMRAKYERVVGSKDSEAFYMVNPDGSGGPELSIYLLRV
ncbi:hypothetical protein RIF29_16265 [Crotalaria pallida]|uniref:Protein MIZU-KUSSEI 1 n=1 Tax=Crotalaria pallida TaxID=3830 RepID=A0AAN9IJP4_CROPI